jgi:cell division septation protein DedD
VDLGGPIETLATSPSTHEIYVGLDDPPRLAAVNRFNLTSRVLTDLTASATAVRPSLFGEGILIAQGAQVSRVAVTGGRPVRVGSIWREDLPVGLPDGRVVIATEQGVSVADLGAGTEVGLEEAALDRWWLPVHWNPTGAIVTADRVTGEVVLAPSPAPQDPEAGVDSAMIAERLEAAPGLRDEVVARVASGPPPGFYAIVGSARQPEGIRSLVQSLEDAGFATEVQSVPDEAGRTWFRGLVGPYRSRSEAEAASRQLLRERRLEAWVTEVGAGGRPEEESI